MILTCPECATSYFVDDSKIPPQGRTVKCASCGARWMAEPEPELELHPDEAEAVPEAADADQEALEERPVSEMPGEELPKVFRAKAETSRRLREAAAQGIVWAALLAVLVVLAIIAVVFRADVVRLWPRSAAAYAGIGLPVNSVGLALEGVKADPALQEGHAALSVTGMIRNVEGHTITAPPLQIRLLNKAGKPVATQIARASDPRIPPGETRHFAIAILDPPLTAHDLEVTFAPESAAPEAKPHVKASPPSAKPHEPALRPAAEPTAPAAEPMDAQPLPPGAPDAIDHHE